MSKSIVVLSGGQDSVTTLYQAIRESDVVAAVFVRYGQRHEVEEHFAHYHACRTGVPLVVLQVPALAEIGDSALVNKSQILGDPHRSTAALPASFVPGRNIVFLTLAAAAAFSRGASEVWTGVCQTDYSGYPDCRHDAIDALEGTLRLALAFPDLRIQTPLMNLSKGQTFGLAKNLCVLHEIIENTHTCYEGDRDDRHDWGYGCGQCPACRVRAAGWSEFKEGKATL